MDAKALGVLRTLSGPPTSLTLRNYGYSVLFDISMGMSEAQMRFRLATTLLIAMTLQGIARAQAPLPYRFLLVISDQWKDPSSYIIGDGGEFQIMAALLKSWGLPFDIMRLDQQRLDKYHLLDRDGRPRYGTIIWDAGPSGLEDKGLSLVPELVKDYRTGLGHPREHGRSA